MVRITTQPFPPFFFFNDTATTEIYTLSLHDALPIYWSYFMLHAASSGTRRELPAESGSRALRDRKSTRLNSSHSQISYAVFCLKKKNPASPSSISESAIGHLISANPAAHRVTRRYES